MRAIETSVHVRPVLHPHCLSTARLLRKLAFIMTLNYSVLLWLNHFDGVGL
jgi:hypothetical protein